MNIGRRRQQTRELDIFEELERSFSPEEREHLISVENEQKANLAHFSFLANLTRTCLDICEIKPNGLLANRDKNCLINCAMLRYDMEVHTSKVFGHGQKKKEIKDQHNDCLLYTSPSPRDS
eukprot:TRINITY_DN5536_c0_g1_i1.p2 TRINITY_DN5536_c0_g1~~TRINITY_DN5536_c0_g1_i1.p2  ORF type:complete len:121 (-),score=14.23 TRINITY_DN5536_c0_g1_i1:1-363(-)